MLVLSPSNCIMWRERTIVTSATKPKDKKIITRKYYNTLL